MKSKGFSFFVTCWIHFVFFRCLLLITSLVIIGKLGYSQTNYWFQHYDTHNGLAADHAESLAQDSLGYIWILHKNSLSRFDGYEFMIYKHEPDQSEKSLYKGELAQLWKDPSRNLWITPISQNPYVLTKYDRRTDGFIKYKIDLSGSRYVRRVRFEKKGATLWFPSRRGLYSFDPATQKTKKYVNMQGDSLESVTSNDIMDVADRDSILLIASSRGLWKFDKTKKTFRRPDIAPKDSAFLSNTEIIFIFERRNSNERSDDDRDDLWIVFHRGINWGFLRIDDNFSIAQRIDLPPEFSDQYNISGANLGIELTGLDRDDSGVFWLGTWGNGLIRFNPLDSSIVLLKRNPEDTYSLKSNHLSDVLVDRDQNLWIATDQGLSRLAQPKINFHNTNIAGGLLHTTTLYKVNEKDYVVVDKTKGDGKHELAMAPIIPQNLDSLQFQSVTTFIGSSVENFYRGRHFLWITMIETGILGVPINPISGAIEKGLHLALRPERNNLITHSLFRAMSSWEDPDGNLWVGTWRGSGLNKIIAGIPYGTKGSVIQYKHNDLDPASIDSDDIHHLYSKDQKSLWVITANGVDLFSNNHFEHIFKDKETPNAVYESTDKVLFIGTSGGLYEGIKFDGHYRFNKVSLLKNEGIIAIDEDKKGRLWISNTVGIVSYDRKEGIAVEFNKRDGLLHYQSAQPNCAPYLSSNGIMVVSDYDGFTLFDPLTFNLNKKKVAPLFTRLLVNNQVPRIGRKESKAEQFFIDKDVSMLDNLVLDYQHNNFTIEFSAMEMTSPEKNLYRHKLQGYDEDWIETDWKNRTATYTNLDAGEYLFKVKASNHHGIWSDQETRLTIIILPPPWKTWWAYTLYGLALVGIFLSWRHYDIKRVKLKHRAEHLSELDSLKTRFFANISHEFRTPITLILGPLKELYSKANSDDQKTVFGTMMRNGQRLLRLINQLLDLSKLEAGKMTMQASQTDMVQFLKEIGSSYESLAADKKIKYFFQAEVQELQMYLDQEKIEKVIHNILSNAFKFTKKNGEVILNLKVQDNQRAVISVKDSGIGIPDHQLNKIFDRFYQADSSQTRDYEGSGIGMALAKELVELHHGTISVESKEGKGSTFTVRLPLSQEYLRKEEMVDSGELKKTRISNEIISEDSRIETTREKETVSESQPVLLIVEDNTDMRNYIRKTLAGSYQIIEAVNGKEGVAKAGESVPDLIISDIMMPEMDGYKLCELIKINELTSHIPVILLTAKADQQSRLTGLEQRADDYLLKPFDADELKLIVRNHIEARQKMREKFSKEITLEPSQIAVSSLDEKFLQKVLGLIEAHMEDENFSIEDFSREAGYSRMQFYRKIKALAGQTPSQFVRTIRLKRAAQMLRKKSDNVTQIAYSVGFGDLSYFNKCFKEQYGVTPGQFSETDLSTPKTKV